MSKIPYMPFLLERYLSDTTHLNTEEHGAYLLLMFEMWRSDMRPIPNKEKNLLHITKLSRYKWQKIRPIVEEFFYIEAGKWHHSRLEKEWNYASRKIEQKRKASDKGNILRNINKNRKPYTKRAKDYQTPSTIGNVLDNNNIVPLRPPGEKQS